MFHEKQFFIAYQVSRETRKFLKIYSNQKS